jgi:repressor LexA
MKILAPKQIVALTVIKTFIDAHGYAPSVRDISKGMGDISPNAVHRHLIALQSKGAISRQPRAARSITINHNV